MRRHLDHQLRAFHCPSFPRDQPIFFVDRIQGPQSAIYSQEFETENSQHKRIWSFPVLSYKTDSDPCEKVQSHLRKKMFMFSRLRHHEKWTVGTDGQRKKMLFRKKLKRGSSCPGLLHRRSTQHPASIPVLSGTSAITVFTLITCFIWSLPGQLLLMVLLPG